MLKFKTAKFLFLLATVVVLILYFKFKFSWFYILPIPLLFLSLIAWGSATIQAGFFMKSICSAKTNENVIALTFDDGPDILKTPAILDLLKNEGIKATFFVIGKKIKGSEAIVERMLQEGHIIANHSYSHSYFIDLFPTKKVIADLESANSIIKSITGYTPKLFRPPYGVTNPNIARAVEKMELTSIGWNIRSLDTIIKDSNKLYQRISTRIEPGSILLFHDTGTNTLEALKEVILFIKKKGYLIIGLEELLNIKPYEEV